MLLLPAHPKESVGEVAPPPHEQGLLKDEAKEVKSVESDLHISPPIRIKDERSFRRFLVEKKATGRTWARWLEKFVEAAAAATSAAWEKFQYVLQEQLCLS